MIEKACYSFSNRSQNLYELPQNKEFSSVVKKQAKSVACFICAQHLRYDAEKGVYRPRYTETLSAKVQKETKIPFGENEPFGNELTLANGTGYLVDKKTLVTAAHCVCYQSERKIDPTKIQQMRVVFGFKIKEEGKITDKFKARNVYSIQSVLSFEYGDDQDWAFLELDRIVENKEPLKICFNRVPKHTPLYMLGYPLGLSIKFVDGAVVKKNESCTYFETDIDAFSGNSGSPVFRLDTYEVVGLLYKGQEDFDVEHNYEGKCGNTRVVRHYVTQEEIDKHGSEKCQRAEMLEAMRYYILAKKEEQDFISRVRTSYASRANDSEKISPVTHFWFFVLRTLETVNTVMNPSVSDYMHFLQATDNLPWRLTIHGVRTFNNNWGALL